MTNMYSVLKKKLSHINFSLVKIFSQYVNTKRLLFYYCLCYVISSLKLYLFYHINFHFVTDDYKWYGVVEYSAPLSQISSIRTELDWKMVDGYHIHCDFLDKSLSSYRKLNSKCLFVDNLPKDFTNTSEFRDIFSALSSPLYCQV